MKSLLAFVGNESNYCDRVKQYHNGVLNDCTKNDESFSALGLRREQAGERDQRLTCLLAPARALIYAPYAQACAAALSQAAPGAPSRGGAVPRAVCGSGTAGECGGGRRVRNDRRVRE